LGKPKKPSIEPTRNGPFLVKDLEDFKNSKGEKIETKPLMYLCRCGGSKNKPFCDGTHVKIGFSDKKDESRLPDKIDTYKGEKLTIHDNRGVCSHRGVCTENAPKVFRVKKKPWIEPNAQDAEETTKVIKTCPSGALSFTKDGKLSKDWDRKPSISIDKDGPYDIIGYIELDDPDGNRPESKEHFTLCRCGHSKNKPFCNGKHWKIIFKDPKN
jgi:CDGSH-type Zn-finger protein